MELCTSCRKGLQVSILLLILISAVTVLCQTTIVGIEGRPVTLPCSYKVKQSSDLTSMCWGRGSCPNSKCNQELIWTDGNKVTFRSSSRYQLYGRIKQGTVSLTVVGVNLQDAGTYCCRIEHKGWFNDEKINIRLTVEQAPTTTVRTTTPTTTTTKKTTQAPTTVKKTPEPPVIQTTSEPSYVWTSSLIIPEEETTQFGPYLIKNTSPPPIRTETSPSYTARTIHPSPNIIPIGSTEYTELTTESSELPAVTTENEISETKPTTNEPSVLPYFIPDHELTTSAESKEEDHGYIPLWPESVSPYNNGISDLFQGNVTKSHKKHTSTVIIAISLSLIALIVICVILLQLKGKKRRHFPLTLDPRLELVTHAEQPLTELKTEEKDSDEDNRAETNHIGNTSEAAQGS
ncbi:uncharacterized protein ACNLHF_017800 [Anomaloglossus baeobatrachus]